MASELCNNSILTSHGLVSDPRQSAAKVFAAIRVVHELLAHGVVGLKKQYLKSQCKVTFSLSKEAVGSAGSVHLVGDFNKWNGTATPMKRLKDGTYTATVTLEKDREYQFRYLLDGQRWENDWNADEYVANEHGGENSVVVV